MPQTACTTTINGINYYCAIVNKELVVQNVALWEMYPNLVSGHLDIHVLVSLQSKILGLNIQDVC